MRPQIKLVEGKGRMFQSDVGEAIVSRRSRNDSAARAWEKRFNSAGASLTIVGIFDAGGTAFDSEIWSTRH